MFCKFISCFLKSNAIILLFNLSVHAGGFDWEPIVVPKAYCGDGSPYKVFIKHGDPEKIAFTFMGGGACWSFATCFGPTPHAWIRGIPFVPDVGGLLTSDPERGPLSDYTHVYFPYCTGDVHLGTHIANYFLGSKVYHTGRYNVKNAITVLHKRNIVDLTKARDVVLYGFSAGAIGLLYHIKYIDKYIKSATHKVLIADSPGLHFGSRFWKKFSPSYIDDFTSAMKSIGFEINTRSGRMAKVLNIVCKNNSGWSVGILQGSRDIVMSRIFGDISQDAHERLIFSKNGIYGMTKNPDDNCAAWVPKSSMHSFLVTDLGTLFEADGKTAIDFATDIIRSGSGRNYR